MNDAFRLWADSYEEGPNALLRLGDRALDSRLGDLTGLRALDAGCGSGRWMRKALAQGARVAGFDGERAMLATAPRGLAVEANFDGAPFQAEAFDLVVASFSLSYADEPATALANLCGLVVPDGRLVIVDLHPDAVDAGWRRTFQTEGRTIEVPSRVQALEAALTSARAGWRIELLDSFRFGEQERELFGPEHWMQVCRVWAVRLAIWRKL